MGQNIRLFNREISWLGFNHRVLQEARDESVPLHEKIKFMAIFSSNSLRAAVIFSGLVKSVMAETAITLAANIIPLCPMEDPTAAVAAHP